MPEGEREEDIISNEIANSLGCATARRTERESGLVASSPPLPSSSVPSLFPRKALSLLLTSMRALPRRRRRHSTSSTDRLVWVAGAEDGRTKTEQRLGLGRWNKVFEARQF